MDIIGLAGFNYDFNSLDPDGQVNELNEAFGTVFSSANDSRLFAVLQAVIPPLRLLVSTASARPVLPSKVLVIYSVQSAPSEPRNLKQLCVALVFS